MLASFLMAFSVFVTEGNCCTENSIWRSVCPNIAPGKVKVCMDWDDSCFTDFRLAELCRKHKAKVTFNITPREHTDHCVMQRETTERNGTTYEENGVSVPEAAFVGNGDLGLVNGDAPGGKSFWICKGDFVSGGHFFTKKVDFDKRERLRNSRGRATTDIT